LGGGKYVKRRCATETQARQELDALSRLHNRDIATGSLDDYLAQWILTKHDVRESTRVSYAAHINNHISPLLGGIPVARLRPADVRRLVQDRLAAGLSPATVRRIHSTLHAALAQGVGERTLVENAASYVKLPRVEREPVQAMTEDMAERITEVTRETFLGPLTELLLGSGMRLGEALGLDQSDLHLEEGFVLVRRSKTKVRAVPVSDDAVNALRRQLTLVPRRGPNEPVFFAPRGTGRLSQATVSHAFPRMLMAAGLPRMHIHLLRHGSASLLLSRGASMKEVAEQLGHATITTTDRFYAHIAVERLRDNVKLLNRRKA
jgi:site-specific recombinase XerD